MSGLDDAARLFVQFDIAGGLVYGWSPLPWENYPHVSTGYYSSSVYPFVPGVFENAAFRVTSIDSHAVPPLSVAYYYITDRSNNLAPPGLYAFAQSEAYTIDFWFKANTDSASLQPIFSNRWGMVGWMMYYQDGVLGQSTVIGLETKMDYRVDCGKKLTGAYHHVEFNRSNGQNRVFVDGKRAFTISDIWEPDLSVKYSFRLGVTEVYLSGVDYDICEIRFSTGEARHTDDFDPPTSAYTAVSYVDHIVADVARISAVPKAEGVYSLSRIVAKPIAGMDAQGGLAAVCGHGQNMVVASVGDICADVPPSVLLPFIGGARANLTAGLADFLEALTFSPGQMIEPVVRIICKLKGNGGIPDLVLPISYFSNQLESDGSVKISVIVPTLEWYEEVKARDDNELVLYKVNLGTGKARMIEEIGRAGIQDVIFEKNAREQIMTLQAGG